MRMRNKCRSSNVCELTCQHSGHQSYVAQVFLRACASSAVNDSAQALCTQTTCQPETGPAASECTHNIGDAAKMTTRTARALPEQHLISLDFCYMHQAPALPRACDAAQYVSLHHATPCICQPVRLRLCCAADEKHDSR
jgi:hypothetical protein